MNQYFVSTCKQQCIKFKIDLYDIFKNIVARFNIVAKPQFFSAAIWFPCVTQNHALKYRVIKGKNDNIAIPQNLYDRERDKHYWRTILNNRTQCCCFFPFTIHFKKITYTHIC